MRPIRVTRTTAERGAGRGLAAPARVTSLRRALRELIYGMSGYEFARHALEERAARETVFMVVTMGDVVGLPVMPPYYTLRLLPYVVDDLAAWKRRALRERAVTDHHDFDLHGL
jgi:hypothetical protein